MPSTRGFVLTSGAAAILACATFAAAPPPATAPTTAPSTQQAGLTVRGKVSVAGGWTLKKPDLTHVVVYLASDPALDNVPHPSTRATVAQRNKTFIPSFLVVPRGTEVEFPNWDNFYHNVFSLSAAAPAFDLDRYPRGQSKTRTFEKLGVVQIFCNIHPHMRAMVFVVPNVFFTRADAEGNFELTGLPPGNYEIVAWHDRCDEQRQTVQVRPGEAADLSLTLKESRDRALGSSDSRGDGGYGVERGLGIKREKLDVPVVTESHPAPADSQP